MLPFKGPMPVEIDTSSGFIVARGVPLRRQYARAVPTDWSSEWWMRRRQTCPHVTWPHCCGVRERTTPYPTRTSAITFLASTGGPASRSMSLPGSKNWRGQAPTVAPPEALERGMATHTFNALRVCSGWPRHSERIEPSSKQPPQPPLEQVESARSAPPSDESSHGHGLLSSQRAIASSAQTLVRGSRAARG